MGRGMVRLLAVALVIAGCAAEDVRVPEAALEDDVVEGLENGSFVAELEGVTLHYEVHGRGPVVMTVPNSWGLTLGGLRAFYEPLEEHLTMVYFDPRGMGESGPIEEDADMGIGAIREDFQALRTHLGQDQVHAIGWSNGAMNLIHLASESPETLLSATFLHIGLRFGPEDMEQLVQDYPELVELGQSFQAATASETMSLEEKDAATKEFFVEQYFPFATAARETASEWLIPLYREVGFSFRHSQYAQAETPVFDGTELLSAITVPSLVVAGAHDMVPPDRIEELHAGLADSRFVVFENSGHFAPVEEPELFLATYLDFLGVSTGQPDDATVTQRGET